MKKMKRPDGIDSLSRGYEYLLRRPLHLIGYVLVAGVLLSLAKVLLDGVGWSSVVVVSTVGTVFRPDTLFVQTSIACILLVVWSWLVTLAFGLVGGIYLLLRYDANGQDVEDFWQPPMVERESLPERERSEKKMN